MLDLGAGTGQMTVRFGKNFSEVLLVDHSKEILVQARKNLSAIENVNFKLIEADALDFIEKTEDSFDFIACSGFLHHLDEADLMKAVNHIYRVLKEKGHALIAEPVKTERTEPALIRWWNKPVVPRLMQYLTLAPAPEETPLSLSSFLEIAFKAGFFEIPKKKLGNLFSIR
jgi:ubiquinone/menaquinone biosynthesis C-methylase UbiE